MSSTAFLSSAHRRPKRRRAAALMLVAGLLVTTPVGATAPAAAANPGVITTWNAVAASTIPPNPAAFLNYAFVHLAMYNAVVGITGEYELYRWQVHGPREASPEAAAAAAAHRVLKTYFGTTPEVAATLDAQLASSLAAVPNGRAKNEGVRYGLRAADRIIALRTNDGRGTAVTVPAATAAGDWRPTSPGTAFAVPWLGLVKPLALQSLTQFHPGPPPAIGSKLYRKELAEVRAYGAAVSSVRTARQEATARYFADIPFGPMEAGLRGVATSQRLDISESARLFAATNTSIADALGTAWKAKLETMWWRPITAIREDHDDLDPRTVADPTWTSLIPAPPYPEWPSGLCSVIGAMTTSLKRVTGDVEITIVSPSMGSRTWGSKAALDQAAVNARVWSGIHFRTSDVVSIDIGTDSANYIFARYFRPTDD
jgi:hypothetical protein